VWEGRREGEENGGLSADVAEGCCAARGDGEAAARVALRQV